MSELDMRISKGPDNNGCYHFSQISIDNIPDIEEFIEDYANKKIKEACENVLTRSMNSSNKYRYGEMGLLISLCNDDVYKEFKGEYHKIVLSNTSYRKITSSRDLTDLVFVHNHPNNSTFSANDIFVLARTKSLCAIVAVGNRHNLFMLIKNTDETIPELEKDITNQAILIAKRDKFRYDKKVYMDIAAAHFLENNVKKYGLNYIKLKRRAFK